MPVIRALSTLHLHASGCSSQASASSTRRPGAHAAPTAARGPAGPAIRTAGPAATATRTTTCDRHPGRDQDARSPIRSGGAAARALRCMRF